MKIEEKATQFHDLHLNHDTFIMANAWNAGSAVMLEQAGFKAIGTTSAGIAYSEALPDYAGKLSFAKSLEKTQEIVNMTTVPVSMDAENVYGDTSREVFENMSQIVKTGVVGASIEDYTGIPKFPLYEIGLAVERIQAAKEAVSGLHYPFTLTARAECYLTGHAEPFKESVSRINQYREAGADCFFVPGIKDVETIAALVKEVDGPVSVVMGLSGSPISLAELKSVGVARVSIGGSLARATFGLIQRAAWEMMDKGTFEFANRQMLDNELCEIFSDRG